MHDAPWLMPMGNVDIGEVDVGTRRREDMGDLDALAKSIQENGLLHPIVVDAGHRLVSGHRRLEACRMLGWEKIPIRSVGNVTPEQMRELELRENLDRKDFTELEKSKNMLALAEIVKERLRKNARDKEFCTSDIQNPLGGRPEKPDNIRTTAKEIGVSPMSVSNAAAHVAAMEQYPVLEPLPKTTAINIARKAKQIAPEKREAFVNAMADSERQYQKECKQIDRDAIASDTVHKALTAAGDVPFSEDMLDAWLRFDEPDAEEVSNLLFSAEQAIANLNAIQAKLRGHNPLRVIRGGKA